LIRRIPKRGFNKYPKKGYHAINLEDLLALKKETSITPEILKEKEIIKGPMNFLKILGDGEITVPLNIKAHAFSKKAIDKIKNAGGKFEIIK